MAEPKPNERDPDSGGQEKAKLRLETEKLRSEVSYTGKFGRVWAPIASLVASAVIGFSALQIQWNQSEYKHREIVEGAVGTATDATATRSRNIGGIWSLERYWGSDADVVAHTLSALLLFGDPKPAQLAEIADNEVRLAAAEAIGAITRDESLRSRWPELGRLLYGDGQRGDIGTITKLHWILLEEREYLRTLKDKEAIRVVNRKLEATREAIRKNYKILNRAHFDGHDLSGIKLYDAELSGANFNNATLFCADLSGANLRGVINWDTISDIRKCNIFQLKNAPKGFQEWAVKHGAVEEPRDRKHWFAFYSANCYGELYGQ